MVRVTKGHAYGNDFLLVPAAGVTGDLASVARAMCHRHEGIGADGLVLYTMHERAATMRLLNADGTWSELSGNGLRCLAALVVREQRLQGGATVRVETDAGSKNLDLLAADSERYTFRAAMGEPSDLRQVSIPIAGETIVASVLRTGNPQCIVLGPLPTPERFNLLGPALSNHPIFPDGTNVEFVQVEAPDRIRILIWERGVGPTSSSGTGSSAAAVAAAAHGGASRSVDVMAPGGVQHVDWADEGIYLTGWAEIVFEGNWVANVS
jgi:diaminopimelate epimerase